ncbi:hypothetical protein HMPREF3188_00625 [Tissierellia bacterium KA00581]|nr:hypothetical protein HMPREF3188_00625 [Tissierellia bacterium KA00581]
MRTREWFLFVLSWIMIFYIQILYKKFVIPRIEKEKNVSLKKFVMYSRIIYFVIVIGLLYFMIFFRH